MGSGPMAAVGASEASELPALRERFVTFILPADPAAGKPIIDIAARWTGSQKEDGSWLVKTRAIRIQPHYESGFPHGMDQFISAAGTNWASTALAMAATK
jgi:hypothetical protein